MLTGEKELKTSTAAVNTSEGKMNTHKILFYTAHVEF